MCSRKATESGSDGLFESLKSREAPTIVCQPRTGNVAEAHQARKPGEAGQGQRRISRPSGRMQPGSGHGRGRRSDLPSTTQAGMHRHARNGARGLWTPSLALDRF